MCPDSIACDGLRSFSNDDSTLNRVHFAWAHASVAVLAIKINCLSTEFAAKKHGEGMGEHNNLGNLPFISFPTLLYFPPLLPLLLIPSLVFSPLP